MDVVTTFALEITHRNPNCSTKRANFLYTAIDEKLRDELRSISGVELTITTESLPCTVVSGGKIVLWSVTWASSLMLVKLATGCCASLSDYSNQRGTTKA